MGSGTGVAYNYSAAAAPRLNDGSDCMEIDSQFLFSGVPWEMTARQYIADTMNAADGSDYLDMTKVTAVSAMEAIGLDDAILKYNNQQPEALKIPSVNFRGMSNMLHVPVRREDDGRWSPVHIEEHIVDGYEFAIASTATTVLEMFKQRCQQLDCQPGAPCSSDASCHYHVSF